MDEMIEQALVLASETNESEENEYITIDIHERNVTVPSGEMLFGVESDEYVEVKHVRILGTTNDGVDISGYQFRVNWRNANKDLGIYLVPEVSVVDGNIEFDWKVSRGVTAYKGTVYFVVCAINSDSIEDDGIANEWNSTLGSGTVLEGLEASAEDVGGEDLLAQLQLIRKNVYDVFAAIAEQYPLETLSDDEIQTILDSV